MYVAVVLLLLPCSYSLFTPSLLNLRRNCGPVTQKPNHLFRGLSPCETGSQIVENARIERTFRDETGRLALTVVCECGALFPDGTTTRTINNVRGRWVVTEHCITPTCTIPLITNTDLTPVSGTVNYMGSLNVTCVDGHILASDDSFSYTSYCLPDGSWTRTEACVEILDCATQTVENAVSITGGPFSYKDEVTVTCEDGYKLCDGTDEYTATCRIDGTWDRTDCCTAVVCAAEGRSGTDLYNNMLPDLSYPTTISVQCDDEHETSDSAKSYEATCTSSAIWIFTEDCIRVACGEVSVSYTTLTDDVLPFTVVGSSVTVECVAGTDLGGQPQYTATCTAAGWDIAVSCEFDECAAETDDCSDSDICIDTPSSYNCVTICPDVIYPASIDSCQGNCGSCCVGDCHCDTVCEFLQDCCNDFCDFCPSSLLDMGSTVVAAGDVPPGRVTP